MSQFDVYANTDTRTNGTYPYFVDVQHDLVSELGTRVVIPLTPAEPEGDQKHPGDLCPIVSVDEKPYALLAYQLTSISVSQLRKPAGSLSAERTRVLSAIDVLLTGI